MLKKIDFIQILLLRVTLAPFWRISTERKQCMLFCVSGVRRHFWWTNPWTSYCAKSCVCVCVCVCVCIGVCIGEVKQPDLTVTCITRWIIRPHSYKFIWFLLVFYEFYGVFFTYSTYLEQLVNLFVSYFNLQVNKNKKRLSLDTY